MDQDYYISLQRNINILESINSTMQMINGIKIPDYCAMLKIICMLNSQPTFIEGDFYEKNGKQMRINFYFHGELGQKNDLFIVEINRERHTKVFIKNKKPITIDYKFKYLNSKDVENIVEVINERLADKN